MIIRVICSSRWKYLRLIHKRSKVKNWFKNRKHDWKKDCSAKRAIVYYEEIRKSLEFGNKIWIGMTKTGPTRAFSCKYEKHSWINFPLDKIKSMKEAFRNIIKDEKDQDIVNWNEFNPTENSRLNNIQQIATERVYGSLPINFFNLIWSSNDWDEKCEKLLERANTIAYLVNQGQISESEGKEFSKSIIRYVEDVFSNNKVTENGISYVGIQNGDKYDNKLINSYPSEVIYRINSIYGRLKTLFHFEELTSIPSFWHLNQLKEILGLSYKSRWYLEGNSHHNLTFFLNRMINWWSVRS